MATQAIRSLPPGVLFMDTPRKVKNRLAQRRLREKRAQEKRAASHHVEELSDTEFENWTTAYPPLQIYSSAIPQQQHIHQIPSAMADPTTISITNNMMPVANVSRDNVDAPLETSATIVDPANYAFETEITSWEAQLFEELFESGALDNATADATIPASSTTSDQSVTSSCPHATQFNDNSNSKLRQSQTALQAFRARLLAIWTEEMGCIATPRYDKSEPEPLLHAAARLGNRQVIQMLLDHGADINARDTEGRTPLHSAIEAYKGDAIIFLLEAGVDVNAHDQQGRTALSMAVQFNCEKAVDLFLRHGADPNLGDSDLLRSTHSGFTKGHRVIDQ
ncbi:hypothetical protein ACHAQH_002617 [Verticillium albo-atrum]